MYEREKLMRRQFGGSVQLSNVISEKHLCYSGPA